MIATTAGRLYAAQATVYYKVLTATGSHRQASYATKEILKAIKPQFKDLIEARYKKIELVRQKPKEITKKILAEYVMRMQTDNFDKQEVYPETVCTFGCWKPRPTAYTPGAGQFKTWAITTDYLHLVSRPIYKGETGYDAQINAVRDAIKMRNTRWSERIDWWAGNLGSETPCGIWVNIFYDMRSGAWITDNELAYEAMLLTQAMDDATIQAWRIKYHYMTERPSMTDSSLFLAMPDPPFPAYVSGHAVISGAAVTILSHFEPKLTSKFEGMLQESVQSRIYAGIHFPQDISEGIKLGKLIGQEVLKNVER